MRPFPLLVLIVVVIPVAAQADEPAKQTLITVGKKTTHITEPLDKEGFVDYVEAINRIKSKGVTPQSNYEVVCRNVMGPDAISKPVRAEYYRRLGIALPEANQEWFVGYLEFAGIKEARQDQRDALRDEFKQLMERPWKADTHPRAAKWLKAVDRQLDAIVEGAQRPHNFTPYVSSESDEVGPMPPTITIQLPSIQQHQEVARSLRIRAMFRIGEGNINGAWADVQGMRQVARQTAKGVTIELLVGIAIDSMAFEAEQQILRSPALTDEQARKFLADHLKLQPLPRAFQVVDVGERYGALDALQFIARSGGRDLLKTLKLINSLLSGRQPSEHYFVAAYRQPDTDQPAKAAVGPDWNVAMETVNGWYDRFVEAAREQNLNKQQALLEEFDADLQKLKGQFTPAIVLLMRLQGGKSAGRSVGGVLVAMMLPATRQVIVAENLGLARLRVMRLGLAAEVFRREKGRYPQRLDELAPAVLKRDMADPMTGRPLRIRAGKTGLIIYSMGRNLQDDNGRGKTDSDADGKFDDVALRIGNPPAAR